MTQTVYVAVYSSKYGDEVAVFNNIKAAQTWREDIAQEYWSDYFEKEKPESKEDSANIYWDRLSQFGEEFFSIYERRLDQ